MTRAFPFIRPPKDVLRPDVWAVVVADGSIPLADVLTDWDYNTRLHLHRTVVVDGARVRETSGLPDKAAVSLAVRWTASGSLLRGLGVRVAVPVVDGHETRLEFVLPGGDLGGTLTLETLLCVSEPVVDAAERAATRPGSILWSESFDVRLQGDAPLFPVAIVDFNDLPYPDDAAWLLEIDEDLEVAALGSILLLVNSRNELLVRALAEAGAPGPDAAAVLSVLRSGVATTLVEYAFTTEDFDPETRYSPHTVGAALAGLLAQLNLDDWESMRRERATEPTLFVARMQDATRLWHGLR